MLHEQLRYSFFIKKRNTAFSFFVKKFIYNFVEIIIVWNEYMKYRLDWLSL